MRPQPMIVLADVEAGSKWFQDVLGLTSGHGGPDYEMLLDGDSVVAQLHRWEADEHPRSATPTIRRGATGCCCGSAPTTWPPCSDGSSSTGRPSSTAH